MKIESEPLAGALAASSHLADPRAGGAATESFANMLDAEALKAEVAANRQAVLDSQGNGAPAEDKDAMDYIREHGMRAYAEEVERRKLEELREKILEAMGLSEEQLAALPAERRDQIERMIADQIQQRMAANSILDDDEGSIDGMPSDVLSGGQTFATGAAMLNILEASQASATARKDDPTG